MHGRIFVRRITKVLDSTQLNSTLPTGSRTFRQAFAQLYDVEEDWQLRDPGKTDLPKGRRGES